MFQVLNRSEMRCQFSIKYRIEGHGTLGLSRLELLLRPRTPFGIRRQDIQQDIGIKDPAHQSSPRVSFISSSVDLPFRKPVASLSQSSSVLFPPFFFGLRTTLRPSVTNSTAVPGFSPKRFRIRCGMVTCPLLVMFMKTGNTNVGITSRKTSASAGPKRRNAHNLCIFSKQHD